MNTVLERDYSALRFLVADDKPFIRKMIHDVLKRFRARQIVHAANGEEALKALREYGGKFDCILSDWNMDPIGGLELLRTVRAGDAASTPADIRFIILTGYADASVVKTALALDVHGYLIKPVSFEKLIRTIEVALTRDITLKPPEHYRAIRGAVVPATIKEPAPKAPPWALWMLKSPKRKQFEERLQVIRRDVVQLKRRPEDTTQIFKNRRRTAVAEIAPGVALAEDIYDADGTLLVGNGIVLNPSLLARLKELAMESGRELKFWIGDQ